MKLTWEYIAGFFDGEGCVTLNSSSDARQASPSYIAAIAQSGTLGKELLMDILGFLVQHGIKGNVHENRGYRNKGYKPMYCLRISSRDSVKKLLRHMLPLVKIKKVACQDALRILLVYPSLHGRVQWHNLCREKVTASQLRQRVKEGKTFASVAKEFGMKEGAVSVRWAILKKQDGRAAEMMSGR